MKQKVYLDNAASSQPAKAVLEAIKPFLSGFFGNPSSLHDYGRKSRQAIENTRANIASQLNANPKEIIFTSGGTESINLAIFGAAKAYASNTHTLGHIIVSKIEHEAVLECVKALKRYGWKVDYAPVDAQGFVDPNQLEKLVRKDTMLVSVMYANNEVGTIEPIAKIGQMIAGINRARQKKNLLPIYFHTDACQAGGVLDLDVQKLKVDFLTLNGSKINGPKGSGILYARTGTKLEPIIYGGGQERGLRSGTENTLGIVGFGTALVYAHKHHVKHVKQLLDLQKYLEAELQNNKLITINGPRNEKFSSKENNFGLKKLPGTINFSVKGVEGEALMLYLDSQGFAVATGSACTTASGEPSHVLLAMGVKKDLLRSTIRLSLGYDISKRELKQFVAVLNKTVDLLNKTVQDL